MPLLAHSAARADTVSDLFTVSYGYAGLSGVSQSLSFFLPQQSAVYTPDSSVLAFSTQVTNGVDPASSPATVSFSYNIFTIALAGSGSGPSAEYKFYYTTPFSSYALSYVGGKGSIQETTFTPGTYTYGPGAASVQLGDQVFNLENAVLTIAAPASTINLTDLPPVVPADPSSPPSTPAAVTPEPSTLAMLGTGLCGLGGLCKRRFRSSSAAVSTHWNMARRRAGLVSSLQR